MVILVNFHSNPFKIEYKSGNKVFSKLIPTNAVVAMKDLRFISQISNKNFLVRKDITVFEYETNTYLNRNAMTPTDSSLPFIFVGNNVKPSQYVNVADVYSGATTASGMTLTARSIASPTVFGFVTSANTSMADGSISAVTIGNNRYISFSGTAISTTNWSQAITSGATLPAGVTIAGIGAGKLGAGSTVYLTASTLDIGSGYILLKNMV